jgi:hypothetical protein
MRHNGNQQSRAFIEAIANRRYRPTFATRNVDLLESTSLR